MPRHPGGLSRTSHQSPTPNTIHTFSVVFETGPQRQWVLCRHRAGSEKSYSRPTVRGGESPAPCPPPRGPRRCDGGAPVPLVTAAGHVVLRIQTQGPHCQRKAAHAVRGHPGRSSGEGAEARAAVHRPKRDGQAAAVGRVGGDWGEGGVTAPAFGVRSGSNWSTARHASSSERCACCTAGGCSSWPKR